MLEMYETSQVSTTTHLILQPQTSIFHLKLMTFLYVHVSPDPDRSALTQVTP